MHPSAMKFGKNFFDIYLNDSIKRTIVDVGSQNINGSLRDCAPTYCQYIGLDFCAGLGVDLVIENPYQLPLDDGTVDAIVCSSVFEHSDFFWELFLEMLRILKPDGLIYLNVPSNGFIHQYPVDSWRFYPDAGLSLVRWAHRKGYSVSLLESFIGGSSFQSAEEDYWQDFVAIFCKNSNYTTNFKNRINRQIEGLSNVHCDGQLVPSTASYYPADYLLFLNKDKQIDLLAKQLTNSNLTISALHSSASWRLTAPLRFFSGLIKQYWSNLSISIKSER
jgi:SAM-dependent methyltransferase